METLISGVRKMEGLTSGARWFFADEERRRNFDFEASSWIGTPFRRFGTRKGVGVDCVHLAAGIYMACGFLDEFEPTRYTFDRASHHDQSLVLMWIEGCGKFAPVTVPAGSETSAVMPGDLLCFKNGRCEHHVGVALGGRQFVHALCDHAVIASLLVDTTYLKRLTAVYRPLNWRAG